MIALAGTIQGNTVIIENDNITNYDVFRGIVTKKDDVVCNAVFLSFTKQKAFVCKIQTKTDNFSTMLGTIKTFLIKPFTVAIEGKGLTEQWSAQNTEWM